jgi:NADPH:quinone reductase-like Zn-dependent oxidoreductase
MEFSGVVESVGNAVTKFRAGDQVFGSTSLRFGAYAEYICISEDRGITTMPVNMKFQEAAAVMFGAMSALCFLRKAAVQTGQKVLVRGASGSVGVFAVQLAKHFGAHVTGVCSTTNLELVKSLGADEVVDYTKEDFSSAGRMYDVIFDTVGAVSAHTLRALKRGGCYVVVGGPPKPSQGGGLGSMIADIVKSVWFSSTGAAKVVGGMVRPQKGDQQFLKGLIEAGKLRTVIDRRYPLEDIAAAHRHAETGHKRGHVVIVLH